MTLVKHVYFFTSALKEANENVNESYRVDFALFLRPLLATVVVAVVVVIKRQGTTFDEL